jgi:hypothetical protein
MLVPVCHHQELSCDSLGDVALEQPESGAGAGMGGIVGSFVLQVSLESIGFLQPLEMQLLFSSESFHQIRNHCELLSLNAMN